jgi:hypothetical protein
MSSGIADLSIGATISCGRSRATAARIVAASAAMANPPPKRKPARCAKVVAA